MARSRTAEIVLSAEERQELERNARGRTVAAGLAQRSRMVLLAALGWSSAKIARSLGVSSATVGLWRRRFAARRLDGLVDAPRPGRPRSIEPSRIEAVVAIVRREAEDGRRSTRVVARETGLSQSTVSRIWRASGAAAAPGKRGGCS